MEIPALYDTCDNCGRFEERKKIHYYLPGNAVKGEEIGICDWCYKFLGGWKGILGRLGTQELSEDIEFLRLREVWR